MKIKKPIIAWSHSALNSFETCPKKHFHSKVKKDFPDAPFDKKSLGVLNHKAFENRIKLGKPLPKYLKHHEPVLSKLINSGYEMLPEIQLAIDMDFNMVSWFDKTVYGRSAIDLAMVNHETKKALVFDWKWAKIKDNDAQLLMSIAFLSLKFPDIEEYSAKYYWANDRKMTGLEAEKADTQMIWNAIMPRVKKLENAVLNSEFPATPSGLCNGWCPVKSCAHYKGKS
jgi:hypothetical protein